MKIVQDQNPIERKLELHRAVVKMSLAGRWMR